MSQLMAFHSEAVSMYHSPLFIVRFGVQTAWSACSYKCILSLDLKSGVVSANVTDWSYTFCRHGAAEQKARSPHLDVTRCSSSIPRPWRVHVWAAQWHTSHSDKCDVWLKERAFRVYSALLESMRPLQAISVGERELVLCELCMEYSKWLLRSCSVLTEVCLCLP